MAKIQKRLRRARIRRGMREKIRGTSQRPRLSVFRSLTTIYVQAIDDAAGHTVAVASSRESDIGNVSGTPTEKSKATGELLAERLKATGIEEVVFDRNTYRYHGRVRALADGVRAGGIQF